MSSAPVEQELIDKRSQLDMHAKMREDPIYLMKYALLFDQFISNFIVNLTSNEPIISLLESAKRN